MNLFKIFSSQKKSNKEVNIFKTPLKSIDSNLTTSRIIENNINKNFNNNENIEEENQQNKLLSLSNQQVININNIAYFKRLKKKKKLSSKEFSSKKKKKKNYMEIKIKPFHIRKSRRLSDANTKIFTEFIRKTLIKQQNQDEKYQMVIKCLSPDYNIRTNEDINLIKNFIKENKIANKIVCDRIKNEVDNENLFLALSNEMDYKYLYSNEKLFTISEKPDYIYLVIKGKLELNELVEFKTDMSLFKYMKYIYTLNNTINKKDKAEVFKLQKTLERNKNIIDISLDEIKYFILLLVKNKLNDIIINNNYKAVFSEDVEELIIDCQNDTFINLQNFYYDKWKRLDSLYIKNIINDLNNELPKIPLEIFNKYNPMISNQKEQLLYNFKRYNLKKIKELKDGDYLGEDTLDENGLRKYSVISIEETHLAYIDYDIYLDIINNYNSKIREKEAKFLKDSIYFRKVSLQYFIKNYFSDFSYQELTFGNNILSQNQPMEYLYFLKDGMIEIYCDKSIIELINLTKILSKNIKGNNEKIKNQLNNLSSQLFIYDRINKNFSTKMITRLLVIMNGDILGIESWISGLPYFYNCRIISEKARFYIIKRNKIEKLLNDIKEIKDHILEDANKRLEVLCKRIIKIINTRVTYINNKIHKANKLNKNIIKEKCENTISKKTFISTKKIYDLIFNQSQKIKDKEKDKQKIPLSTLFRLTFTSPDFKKSGQFNTDRANDTEEYKFGRTQYFKKNNNIAIKKLFLGKNKENFDSKMMNSFKSNNKNTPFTLSEKNLNSKELYKKLNDIDNDIKDDDTIKHKNKEFYSIKNEIKLVNKLNNRLENELLLSKSKSKKILNKEESKLSEIEYFNIKKKSRTLIIKQIPIEINFKNEINNNKTRSRIKSMDIELKNGLTLDLNKDKKDDYITKINSIDLKRKFPEIKNLYQDTKNLLSIIKKNNKHISKSTQKNLNIFYNTEKKDFIEGCKFKGSRLCITERERYKKKIYKLIHKKIKDPNYFTN